MAKKFTYEDIKWIKSVSNKTDEGAYIHTKVGKNFKLHFPSNDKNKKNANNALNGELILLIQKRKDKKHYFTHLVTPIDKHVQEDKNNNSEYKYYRTVKTIALCMDKIPTSSTMAKNTNFQGIARRGYLCNVINNKSLPKEKNKFLKQIWEKFSMSAYYLKNIPNTPEQKDEEDSQASIEGKKKLREHYVIERDYKIIKKKKEQALKKDPDLKCEVCGFSFKKYYSVEFYFIECHHKIPLSKLTKRGKKQVETNLEDLAIVCANCHRMLHKIKLKNGVDIGIEDLKKKIKK